MVSSPLPTTAIGGPRPAESAPRCAAVDPSAGPRPPRCRPRPAPLPSAAAVSIPPTVAMAGSDDGHRRQGQRAERASVKRMPGGSGSSARPSGSPAAHDANGVVRTFGAPPPERRDRPSPPTAPTSRPALALPGPGGPARCACQGGHRRSPATAPVATSPTEPGATSGGSWHRARPVRHQRLRPAGPTRPGTTGALTPPTEPAPRDRSAG